METTPRSDLDLSELRSIAEAATPGPWLAGDVWVYTDPVYDDDDRLSNVLGTKYADEERARIERERGLRNVAHIAAFDPSTALALLAQLEAAEKVIAEALDHLGDANAWDGHARADQLDGARGILSAYTKGTIHEDGSGR